MRTSERPSAQSWGFLARRTPMFIYACFYKLCRKFYATSYEIGQEKFARDFYPCKIRLLNFISKILAEKVGPQHRQCSWCFGNMICCKNITMNRFQQWPLGNMRCCKPSPLQQGWSVSPALSVEICQFTFCMYERAHRSGAE